MKEIIFILLAFTLISCSDSYEVKRKSINNERTIKVVFYNFYDEKVVLKINGKKVLDSLLTPEDRSIGISLMTEYNVMDKNIFELSFGDVNIKQIVDINASIKYIYIRPTVKPYIKLTTFKAIIN